MLKEGPKVREFIRNEGPEVIIIMIAINKSLKIKFKTRVDIYLKVQ